MKKLVRTLGLSSAVSIGIGAALGSGVFVLPAVAIAHTGPSAWLAYLVAAICIVPACLSKAELATAMPTSGGTYVFVERTYGPLAGTVVGLGLFFTMLLKSTFALIGFSAYLTVLTHLPLQTTALSLLVVIVMLNILGVGKVSGALIVVVILSVVSLAILTIFGSLDMDYSLMEPLFPSGQGEFLYTVTIVFVAYAGVTKLAAIAEEIKDPGKNLPLGILLSVFLVTILYCGVSFVLAGILPQEAFVNDLKPIHTLAQAVGGDWAGWAAAIIAILTMTSMANAGILAASRFPFAMARDQLMPSIFGRINARFLTPIWSIVLSGVVVVVCILQFDVESLAKWASAYLFLIFAIMNTCVVVLRETRVQWYKPHYRAPLYPWMQIIGIAISIYVFFVMGMTVLVAGFAISVPGVLLYIFFGSKSQERRGVLGFRGRRKDLVDEAVKPSLPKSVENLDFSQEAQVVVSLFGKERSPEILFEMGVALAEGGKVEVVSLTEIPEQTDLDDLEDDTPTVRSIQRRIMAMSFKQKVQISFDPVVSHDIYKTIFDISNRLHCRWLVTEWVGHTRGAYTIHDSMGWLRNHLSCNLAMVRDKGVRYYRKILVLLKANAQDRFIIETAEHLAEQHFADLTFARVCCGDPTEEILNREMDYLKDVAQYASHTPETMILEGRTVDKAVVAASVDFDLLIFGSFTKETWFKKTFGSTEHKIMSQAACSVISVQASREDRYWTGQSAKESAGGSSSEPSSSEPSS